MARGETVDPRLREALAMKLRWVDGLASDEEWPEPGPSQGRRKERGLERTLEPSPGRTLP